LRGQAAERPCWALEARSRAVLGGGSGSGPSDDLDGDRFPGDAGQAGQRGKGSAARFTIRGRCRPGSPDLSRALVGGVEVDGVEPECLGQLGPGAGGGLRAHDPECGDGITPLVMTRAGRAALSVPRRHYSASRLREATHFGVGSLLGGRRRGDAFRAGVRLGPRG
jgi:hypothetical protein